MIVSQMGFVVPTNENFVRKSGYLYSRIASTCNWYGISKRSVKLETEERAGGVLDFLTVLIFEYDMIGIDFFDEFDERDGNASSFCRSKLRLFFGNTELDDSYRQRMSLNLEKCLPIKYVL